MKKFWQLFSILFIAFFLVACGGGDENGEENTNEDEQQTNKEANENGNENENETETEQNEQAEDNENGTETEQNEQAEEDNNDNTQDQAGSVGDMIQYQDLEITLNDAYTSEGGQFETPSNDQYLILDLTIENKSDEAENISTLLQMSVQDDEGYTYDVTIFTETKGSLDGEIGPNREVRGEVAFDVDESSTYEFIFEDPFASGQAIWSISVNE